MLFSIFRGHSVLACILLCRVAFVLAFFPTPFRENLVGRGGVSHETQTEEVFKNLALQYFPFLSDLTLPMINARDTIKQANAGVDKNQHDSALHFDGENFAGGQTRLSTLFTQVVDALVASDADTARMTLGQALHTIQDFYSHRYVSEMI
jgi:hypothetical protein